MSDFARSELREASFELPQQEFCSYCGHPPVRRAADNADRVCGRCNLGMVLSAPVIAAPREGSRFLIVDQRLVIQGVSRAAERLLVVDEPDGVNAPLGEYLMPAEGRNDWGELARLVKLSVAGNPSPMVIELRTVSHPIVWFAARVSSCGPPPAALLLLTPLGARRSRGGVW